LGSGNLSPINNNKYNNIIGVTKKSDTQVILKKPTAKERNIEYTPLVTYLSKIIQTKKNIKHTSLQLNSWANEFRRLEEDTGVSRQRIKKALQWYSSNIGGEYIPVIESGASFREKFSKLEDAMQRASSPRKKKLSKPPIYDDGVKYVWNDEKEYYVHCVSGERYIP
jgi:hypothetical protein